MPWSIVTTAFKVFDWLLAPCNTIARCQWVSMAARDLTKPWKVCHQYLPINEKIIKNNKSFVPNRPGCYGAKGGGMICLPGDPCTKCFWSYIYDRYGSVIWMLWVITWEYFMNYIKWMRMGISNVLSNWRDGTVTLYIENRMAAISICFDIFMPYCLWIMLVYSV